MLVRFLSSSIIFLFCLIALGESPNTELTKLVKHLENPANQGEFRYLSMYNIEPEQRAEIVSVVTFVLNSISRADIVIQLERIEDTILRFSITDVAPREPDRVAWIAAWEMLASYDPYWHIRTSIKTGTVYTDGGWLNLENAKFVHEVCRTSGGLLRADWFVSKVVLPPHYYNFVGVPAKESEWYEKKLGLNIDTVKRLSGVQGANIFRSKVTDSPRRIARWPLASGGALWATYDVAKPIAAKDTFREPRDFKYDASEHIALLQPKGLMVYALFDVEGNRANAVPSDIAIDHSHLTPVPVPLQPMLSCIRCHSKENGLLSFQDEQSQLLSSIIADSPETIQRLGSFYGRQKRLLRYLERDREDYIESVSLAAIEITPEQIGEMVNRTYLNYVRRDISLDIAAKELGVTIERFIEGVSHTSDPLLLALLKGIEVQRTQFEFSYAEASILIQEEQNK